MMKEIKMEDQKVAELDHISKLLCHSLPANACKSWVLSNSSTMKGIGQWGSLSFEGRFIKPTRRAVIFPLNTHVEFSYCCHVICPNIQYPV